MFFLSVRYLKSRKKQTFLTILGIFFGAAAFIVISGFFIGFQEYLVQQMVSNNAHIHILAREEFLYSHSLDNNFYELKKDTHIFWDVAPNGRKDSARIENPMSWYKRLENDPKVLAYSPQYNASVLLYKAGSAVTATLIGCNPRQQVKVTNIAEYMVHGSFDSLSIGGSRIIVGSELLSKLGAALDQTILISSNQKKMPFKIVGVFNTGNKVADLQAYSAIEEVQKLNGNPNVVNEIAVKIFDYAKSLEVAQNWGLLGQEKVESWDQQNASFLSVFYIQNVVKNLTIVVILIVAAFGIYNVLNMTVNQKKKDIAILHSLGYSSSNIVFLFLYQGIILGITGGILGIIAGYFICLYLQTIPFAGGPMSSKSDYLHIAIEFTIYIQAIILALFTSMFASILPALAAGRLTPIQIIREGAE